MKDIRTVLSMNRNSKGQYHGYQEWYSNSLTKVLYRGNFKNDIRIGYVEYHSIKKTIFLII